jgi:hypothetical protein
MSRSAAVPFVLRRGDDVMTDVVWSSTSETVNGLLRLEGDRLVIQWRVARETDHWGVTEMRTEKEVEPVREIEVSVRDVAGAHVRRRWLDRLTGPRLVLTAADLRAFEEVAGEGGLRLDHPAKIVLRLRRADRLAGEEFSAELALAVAEASVRSAEERAALEGVRQPTRSPEVGS